MDSHDEIGCRVSDGPILCVNNCGFFGSAATMNMCSKCHKAAITKQGQAERAASSIERFVNGSSDRNGKEPVPVAALDVQPGNIDSKIVSAEPSVGPSKMTFGGLKKKESPNRCTTCRKRVGLTGFDCRCGNLYCAAHRYSDKHDCPFDYQAAARDAISKANPVVRAEKVDKI